MTVAELIKQLQALPPSALTATVTVALIDYDDDEITESIATVNYEHGEVTLIHVGLDR